MMSTLHQTLDYLKNKVVGREHELHLLAVGLLARQHIVIIGPPGTAKSLLCDSLAGALGGSVFRVAVSRDTTPDELLGPLDVAAFKAGRLRRVVEGRLPCATIAFLDEVFAGSSVLLNTLLAILNERRFFDDGAWRSIPLECVLAASNRWPLGEGDDAELGAFADRFLLRTTQDYLPLASFDELVWGDHTIEAVPRYPLEQLHRDQQTAARLKWTDEARAAYKNIVMALLKERVRPGDRRLVQSRYAVQAAAFLDGSDEVRVEHLHVLCNTLWVVPEQESTVAEVVARELGVVSPSQLAAELAELFASFTEAVAHADLLRLNEVSVKVREIVEEAGRLRTPRGRDILSQARALNHQVIAAMAAIATR